MGNDAILIQFDLETLALHPTKAVVGEVGVSMYHFTYADGVKVLAHEVKSWKLDIQDQLAMGRIFDESTVLWWLQQGDAARAQIADRSGAWSFMAGMQSIDRAVEAFIGDSKNVFVLTSAPNFDMSNIHAMYQEARLELPWKFWNEHSQRSIRAMLPKALHPIRDTTAHTAADDAEYQNKVVLELFNHDDTRQGIINFFKLES